MEVVFLGTSAGSPTLDRNVQSAVVRLESGRSVVVDCGEGTQQQVLKFNEKAVAEGAPRLKASQMATVLVTHLHGDHAFGLPGLCCLLDASCPEGEPLRIAGPVGIRRYLTTILAMSRTEIKRGLYFIELDGHPDDDEEDRHFASPYTHEQAGLSRRVAAARGVWDVFSDGEIAVKAAALDHAGVPCFAYVFEEPRRLGKVDAAAVRAAASKAGESPKRLFSLLRTVDDDRVVLADGSSLELASVFVGGRRTLRGRKVAVLGDLRAQRRHALIELCRDADVLVHEATLDAELFDAAFQRGHSTPADAGALARVAQCTALVLWHFSPRYEGDASWRARFLEQARRADGPGNDLLTSSEENGTTTVQADHDPVITGSLAFTGPIHIAHDFFRLPVPRPQVVAGGGAAAVTTS